MLELARERGLASAYAAIMPENKTMIGLAKELGFRNVYEDNKLVIVEISL